MNSTMIGILVAGYIVSVVFLNIVCYLISSFYQRKFSEYSPKAGFLFAAVIGLVVALSVPIFKNPSLIIAAAQTIGLISCAIAMALNVISLYYRMKRIRK